MSKPINPIIFIGMHRSGTSMLGRALGGLGLFTGAVKDENAEAIFFQKINVWLLQQAGGRWDMPGAIDYLWESEARLALIERYIRNLMAGPRRIQFLGMTRGGFPGLDSPWGWKDPRNTFTLPMWLRIFPEAKVLLIERNGADVAKSLRVREEREMAAAAAAYERHRYLYFLRPKGGGFTSSPRCSTLVGGLSLWREYTDRAHKAVENLPSTRTLLLRYEDILADPIPELRVAAAFCGLSPTDQDFSRVATRIDRSKSRKNENDPLLGVLDSIS